MKRFFLFAIVLAMTVCMMASCASVNNKQLEIVVGQAEGVQATLGTVVNNNIQPDSNNANREPAVNIIVPDNIVVDNNTGSGNNANTNTGNSGNTGNTGNTGNIGDTNTGDTNTGDTNIGDTNTGDTNTGDTNTGDTNTGDTNTGDTNTGDTNTGDTNTGDTNTGDTNTGDTNTGDTNTGDENGEENGEEEKPEINPDDKSSGYYKVISYNLKAMYYDVLNDGATKDQREGVANYLKQHDADIIGLQEIDYNNKRSFSYDQMKYLSEQLGYEYFYCAAMEYEDGHKYGTGILSRYPIKDAKRVYYDVQDPRTSEKRAYSRAVIEFPEGDLVFYNTHLCTASSTDPTKEAGQQFNQVLRAIYNEKGPAVLTADYNLQLEVRSAMVDHSKVTQLNGGKDQIFFTDGLPIDDIYIRNLDYYTNESDGLSIFKHERADAPWSDHIPCWGYFKFKGK